MAAVHGSEDEQSRPSEARKYWRWEVRASFVTVTGIRGASLVSKRPMFLVG